MLCFHIKDSKMPIMNKVKQRYMDTYCQKCSLSGNNPCTSLLVIKDISANVTCSYHRVCNYINTTGATSGAGTAYPSRSPEFIPGF